MSRKIGKLFILAVIASIATACNDHKATKSSGQVVAKVNGSEITAHQLNFALNQAGSRGESDVDQIQKKVLEKLTDETLIYQQALAEKVDRDLNALVAIEMVQQQVLSKIWLEKTAAKAPKPSNKDIERFYFDHPDLFAKHKTYKLVELTIAKQADKESELKELLINAKQFSELLKRLKADKYTFKEENKTTPAELVPLEILPSYTNLGEDRYLTFDRPDGYLVISVVSYTEDRIDLDKATPQIEKYLFKNNQKEFVDNELKALREKAKIEYFDKFKDLNKPTQASGGN